MVAGLFVMVIRRFRVFGRNSFFLEIWMRAFVSFWYFINVLFFLFRMVFIRFLGIVIFISFLAFSVVNFFVVRKFSVVFVAVVAVISGLFFSFVLSFVSVSR